MKKSILNSSLGSVLVMILASPAIAQTSPQSSDEIAEVVVTAQRFTETAQKAPIIISVISPEQLKGVTDIKQLQTLQPGIHLGDSGSVVQTYIRGVGSENAQNIQESAVAFNVDGVFLYTSTMISPLMYDLERVEVLKGPQGTLYGRNASGGAVNLITNGAELDKFGGYVEGELGNYHLKRATGAVNIPLGSTLAVRLAGQHVDHDGYLSDGSDDDDTTSGRIRVLWEPSAKIKVQLGADASTTNAQGPGSSVTPNPTNDKFVGGLDPRLDTGPFYLGGTSLLALPPINPSFKNDQWSINGQLDADLGFATLTVIPAYRSEELRYHSWTSGFDQFESPRSSQKSIEARLANQVGMSRWVVGAYYFKIDQKDPDGIRNEAKFQVATFPGQKRLVESYAVFGEGTYALTDRLRAIAGLRYSQERTGTTGALNFELGPPGLGATPAYNPFNPVTNPTGEVLDFPIANRSKAHALTWKFGGEFDVAPNSLLFATASRGFKGGGTYVDLPMFNSSFRPEFVTALELGSRNRFLDNRLQLNGELFYWKLKDQQIPFVTTDPVGVIIFKTENAGKAHMYGADLDLVWRATGDDTLRAGVEYLHAEYDEFTRKVPTFALGAFTTTACNVSDIGGGMAAIDCAGQQMIRSPKWSGYAAYEHRFDLGENGEFKFNGDMTFATSRFISPVYTEIFKQKATALFNASLTYTPPSRNVSITAWVRNIGNKRVMAGGDQDEATFGRPTLQQPRTAGVSARYSF